MAQENTNATEGYQMKTGWGTIAMLISATGMGLVPLFSRWATRTDMFDGTMGLNAGDSIGALMACVSSNLSRYHRSPGLVPAISKRRYRE